MRSVTLHLPYNLPSRNESEALARNNKYGAANVKRQWTNAVARAARGQLGIAWVPMDRFEVEVLFKQPDKRKDPDNIIGGLKYLLDGLTDGGAIKGDRWSNVKAIRTSWKVDKQAPGVVVQLVEVP
jgi:Holliday junction resolvase RusA-like endonuclease